MPEVFVEYMIDCARTLDPKGVFRMLQSTFISYGGPDTAFAQQLNDALLKNGVTTFFFAKDAVPGKKLHRLMREGVNEHDRVILVCSQASLDRPGVLNEVTETLQREARDGGKEYLIPITLDDYVFTGWKPEDPGIAQAIKDRVVADFPWGGRGPGEVQRGPAQAHRSLEEVAWSRKSRSRTGAAAHAGCPCAPGRSVAAARRARRRWAGWGRTPWRRGAPAGRRGR